eukprot:724207-Pelagomonas_calceolata.AAC.2
MEPNAMQCQHALQARPLLHRQTADDRPANTVGQLEGKQQKLKMKPSKAVQHKSGQRQWVRMHVLHIMLQTCMQVMPGATFLVEA